MTEGQIRNVVLDFLKEWLDWAENDEHEGYKFSKRYGLCANFEEYIDDMHQDVSEDTTERLLDVFGEIIGEEAYPFGGIVTYLREGDRKEMHKNQERLYFVKDTICKMGG